MRLQSIPRPSRLPSTRRLGAAAAEFAMCAWMLAVLVCGMMEIGRAISVKESLTDAARRGARIAALPGMSYATVTSAVTNSLKDFFSTTAVTNAKITVEQATGPGAGVAWTSPPTPTWTTVTDLSSVKRGDALRVSVTVNVEDTLFMYGWWMKSGTIESERCTMLRQG